MSAPTNPRSTRSRNGSGLYPRRLGDYELIEEIGRGAMGRVFRATELRSGREVAVKILAPGLMGDREVVGRFRHEAQAAAGLDHPGIVQVYEQGEAAGTLYFAMQLVSGKSLADLLFDRVRLPPEQVLSLAVQAAEALAHAHRAGVTHRDIKPANLITDRDGHCMIADFGVALATAQTRLTRSGESLGSPHYMAPEAIRGEEPDGRNDLYSLGIVLFEALTGEKPYPGRSFMAVFQAHLAEPLPHVRELDRTLPEELDRIVAHLMAKDREDRYQTAEELASDLRRMALGETNALDSHRIESAALSEAPVREGGHGTSARRLLLGFILVALAVAAVVYVATTRPWQSSRPPLVGEEAIFHEPTTTPDAATALDPPQSPDPTEEMATTALPSTAEPGPEAPAPAPAARPEPEKTTPAPLPGVLILASDYPTTVRFRGRTVDVSLPNAPLELAPGRYELQLEAPSVFYRATHSIEIRSGERTRLRLPMTTTVKVAASPSRCRVRLDGQDLGFVPLTLDLVLGRHRFEFEWQHLGVTSSFEREVTAETARVFATANPY
jgi:serine/threonine protein kinase